MLALSAPATPSTLNELRQRIREVRRDPDGRLYVLTDEDDGTLLRIEPVS